MPEPGYENDKQFVSFGMRGKIIFPKESQTSPPRVDYNITQMHNTHTQAQARTSKQENQWWKNSGSTSTNYGNNGSGNYNGYGGMLINGVAINNPVVRNSLPTHYANIGSNNYTIIRN